jgi:hypothetical protein
MAQETQNSADTLNIVDTLWQAASHFQVHDVNFGTEYTQVPEGFLTPEEVKQLKEQAVAKFRQIHRILFGKESEPKSDNPTNELEITFGIKAFYDAEKIERIAMENRSELTPLLAELVELAKVIDADNEKFCKHPINTEALPTGDDDLW